MAGLFASAMSTFDSAINAMASCLVADIYLPWRAWRLRRVGRAETPGATHVAASRAAVALMGAGLTVFAVLAVHMQHSGNTRLIDFALGVMAFALAPLLGVFCAALFTRRGNGASMLLSTAAGVAMVLLLQPWMFPAARWEWSVGWPWHWVIVSPVCFLICIAGKPAPARGAEGPEDAAC
jgi:Na+/proline symporter